MNTLKSAAGLVVIAVGLSLTAVAHPTEADALALSVANIDSASEYEEYLEDSAVPGSEKTLQQFRTLSPQKRERLVDILADPAYVEEFAYFVESSETALPGRALTKSSSEFPGEVSFRESSELTALPVSGSGKTGGMAGIQTTYPANVTRTLSATSQSWILGVPVTTLKIWVTFKTGTIGVPKSVVSSGSSATNFNFIIVISSNNLTPYIQTPQGFAVAKTVWTGSALVQNGAIRIDKLHTLKAWQGGLWSHTLVNQ